MGFHFYNTLTRTLEPFVPSESIRLYTCGPTVYDHAHIGNFRAYLFEDLLQRHLESRGYLVHRVMNLTDVDDKTIRGARAKGMSLADYTAPYKEAFFADSTSLRLRPAQVYPAATDPENIAAMIAMIQELIRQGHAYQAEDQSVYFRISSFPDYGKLAHVDLQAQRSSARMKNKLPSKFACVDEVPGASSAQQLSVHEALDDASTGATPQFATQVEFRRQLNDEYAKEEVADFALWKAWDPEDGDVHWESPWGQGRPGWHIECSAMATRILGDQIDIHCGGIDNIFPHHEAEIAQCECVTGKTFSRLWMHCAHLMVDGSKMAKSAGNFYTLRDLMTRGWSGREIRYALLAAHYRIPLNFTMEGLEAARQSLHRIDEWIRRLHDFIAEAPQDALSSKPALKFAEADEGQEVDGAVASRQFKLPVEVEAFDFSDLFLTSSSSFNFDCCEAACTDATQPVAASSEFQSRFSEALDDDLNISAALAVLFDVIRKSHRLLDAKALSLSQAQALLLWWKNVDAVLAVAPDLTEESIPEEVSKLLALRQAARTSKKWAESDRLRDQIAALGWTVKDTKTEQKVIKS